jgi:hypothetical protein
MGGDAGNFVNLSFKKHFLPMFFTEIIGCIDVVEFVLLVVLVRLVRLVMLVFVGLIS